MSELMTRAAVYLSLYLPDKFPMGVNGDAEIEDACRCVLATFKEYLAEQQTEVEIAAELLKRYPGDTDLTAARVAVRDVLDVLWDLLERSGAVVS